MHTHHTVGEGLQRKGSNAVKAGALEEDESEVVCVDGTPVPAGFPAANVFLPPGCLPEEVQ